MIQTPWPNLRLYARPCGLVDPYDAANAALFRGEEAFADDLEGWRRWSKPSPEPRLDAEFEPILLDSIAQQAPQIGAMARVLANKIASANPNEPPVLVAVLRAGVPVSALLAPLLSAYYGAPVPVCAFSLFYGLGWDDVALEQIIADFPDRPLVFVDGWTSGGGVARQIQISFEAWKARGRADFAAGTTPQFAVLCDPRGAATHSAIRADFWVPSAAFTAPETLGFSRGFAFENGSLFGVYRFPREQLKPHWVAAWLDILNVPEQSGTGVFFQSGRGDFEKLEADVSSALPPDDAPATHSAPDEFRVHVNEVTRALINRDPREIWLRLGESAARQTLAPLLYLAQKRGVPVEFGRAELDNWGALALARMK